MVNSPHQIRALILKSFTIQLRQKGTNICQITTPIGCLMLIFLMKQIVTVKLTSNINQPYSLAESPRFLNPPMIPRWKYYQQMELGTNSCLQWYLYEVKDPSSQQYIGNLTGSPNHGQTKSGLLGQIPNYYCEQQLRNTPFFAKPKSTINQDIFQVFTVVDSIKMFHLETDFKTEIPDGAITFKQVSKNKLKYKVQANDDPSKTYHRSNGITRIGLNKQSSGHFITVTDGLLSLMDKIHTAQFNLLFKHSKIITFVQYMPIKYEEKQQLNKLLNILGASLYPIALSLLLPVFMYSIVLEKQEKLLDFMKMNGMRMQNYWIVSFSFNLMIYLITVIIFLLTGNFVVKLGFFTQTNMWIMTLLLLGWGIAQIGLAFIIQAFISKARTATIWGYLLSLWTVLGGVTLNVAVYPLPQSLPGYLLIFPHFSMARGIYILSYYCGYWKCIETFSQASEELNWAIASLWITGPTIIGIALYINQIIPSQFGISRHPFFLCKRKRRMDQYEQFSDQPMNPSVQIGYPEQDGAVKQQRLEVYQTPYPYTNPLIIKDLTKIYKGKYGTPDILAVDKMCLKIEQGDFFGLLGPNGAGKTTLISMLTGLYKPDSGNAWISGHDIVSELDSVQRCMGVCPQFDILWPDLTVEQHLLFYARLKGIQKTEQKQKVKQATDEVLLSKFKHLKSKNLSGGMKRRLSVAISLVGNPKIIFLDQPTTGLDPQNRRQLWEILAKCRQGRAIFLTTHSMQEADVLCTKISIVNQGILRCIGPQVVLKSIYGGGYHLFVNVKRIENHHGILVQSVKSFISESLPESILVSQFNGNLVYQVPKSSCRLSFVFRKFQLQKEKVGISDWGMSQSSLEDVFFRIIGD